MMLKTFKRSGLWMFAIALLMAAQVALALHTVDHQFGVDGTTPSEHCVLCHGSTAMAPAPIVTVAAPTLYLINSSPEIEARSIIFATSVAGFRSRAPPFSVSV